MDPEQMLTRATVELEAAEAELRVAQQRVEELRTIQQGIQLAIQRYGHAVALPTPTLEDTAHVPSPGGDSGEAVYDPSTSSRVPETMIHVKSDVTHSDLCIATLREFGRPARSTEIRERLRQRGKEFDADQTRGTMAYLLRKKRVVRTAPGVWALPEHATAAPNGVSPRFGSDRNH